MATKNTDLRPFQYLMERHKFYKRKWFRAQERNKETPNDDDAKMAEAYYNYAESFLAAAEVVLNARIK